MKIKIYPSPYTNFAKQSSYESRSPKVYIQNWYKQIQLYRAQKMREGTKSKNEKQKQNNE